MRQSLAPVGNQPTHGKKRLSEKAAFFWPKRVEMVKNSRYEEETSGISPLVRVKVRGESKESAPFLLQKVPLAAYSANISVSLSSVAF